MPEGTKWTLESLKDLMDSRFADQDEAINVAMTSVQKIADIHAASHTREHDASQRAIDKAEQAVNQRLEAMNEFRGALKDAQALSVTQHEFEAVMERVQKMENWRSAQEGVKTGSLDLRSLVFSMVAATAAIAGIAVAVLSRR